MTWFRPETEDVLPSAWGYNAPTNDSSSGSTSLVAAATVRHSFGESTKIKKKSSGGGWQEEAWQMYDQVGELRYISNAISGRAALAKLYVEQDGDRLDDEDPLLELITPQMVERLALNLFVAGEGWLGGVPKENGVEWGIYSTAEVKDSGSRKVTIRGEDYPANKVYLSRVWDPHPRKWDEADSPVRSCLGVLRELVGYSHHTSATIDSRLGGAGILWIPNTILSGGARVPETALSYNENPVLNAIMTAMLTPIEDRSSASAIVPLLLGAPDDAISKIRYDTFATNFDKSTNELRESAIRRLGLGLDAPPELLLGMGDANHWGMWLVRDEVVQAHIVPRLDVICDALTTAFYRPLKRQVDATQDPLSFVVRADVSHLVQRPNRLADASQLHAVNVIGDKALREAANFDDTDAPTSIERATTLALSIASGNPQLLDNLPEIVTALMAVLDGTPTTGPDTISSAREPGTLRPRVPGAQPVAPTPVTPAQGVKPLESVDGEPPAGNPVA